MLRSCRCSSSSCICFSKVACCTRREAFGYLMLVLYINGRWCKSGDLIVLGILRFTVKTGSGDRNYCSMLLYYVDYVVIIVYLLNQITISLLTGCRHNFQFLEPSGRSIVSSESAAIVCAVQAIHRAAYHGALSTLPVWHVHGMCSRSKSGVIENK